MMRPTLADLEIEADRATPAFDHDGNLVHDVGRFHGDLGMDITAQGGYGVLDQFEDVDAFVEACNAYRSGAEEPAAYVYPENEGRSDGEEKSVLIAERRHEQGDIAQDDLMAAGRALADAGYRDIFRRGSISFLNDLAAVTHPVVLSAGDEDILHGLYGAIDDIDDERILIRGTKQDWNRMGIADGCGNSRKLDRFDDAASTRSHELPQRPLVYTGDSGSDRAPLANASLGGASDEGAEPFADYMVAENPWQEREPAWYGHIGAYLGYCAMLQGMPEDEAADEIARYLDGIVEEDHVDHIGVRPAGNDGYHHLNDRYDTDQTIGEYLSDIWQRTQARLKEI